MPPQTLDPKNARADRSILNDLSGPAHTTSREMFNLANESIGDEEKAKANFASDPVGVIRAKSNSIARGSAFLQEPNVRSAYDYGSKPPDKPFSKIGK